MAERSSTGPAAPEPEPSALSSGKRAALVALLVTPLVGVALHITLARDEGEVAEPPSPPVEGAAQQPAELPQRPHEQEHRHDPGHGEPGPRPRDLALARRTGRSAEPTARRFWAGFSRYELGDVGPDVRRGLRAAATDELARELLDAPPRVPAGAGRPERGELVGALEFVPLRGDAAGRRIVAGDLVGEVLRGGERTPISFSMVLEGEGWRVAELGR